jgi:hypothetical protein
MAIKKVKKLIDKKLGQVLNIFLYLALRNGDYAGWHWLTVTIKNAFLLRHLKVSVFLNTPEHSAQ